jgi:SOS-response transcriptional repressor LexA
VDLTLKQINILRSIARSIDRNGTQPSYREICKEYGWVSPNAVKETVDALERNGVVRRMGARAIAFDWREYLGGRK